MTEKTRLDGGLHEKGYHTKGRVSKAGLNRYPQSCYDLLVKVISEAKILSGTRVLVRCDLDVPIKDGQILEPFRLESSLETLRYILEKGGLPIVCGHMGRPKGSFDPSLSTTQLEAFFKDRLGENFELLENLRFDAREEQNSDDFAKELAQKANIYVNESFATCHREAASITGLPKFLPSYAGFRLAKEVEVLSKVLSLPNRPLVAIIGGAKLETKKPLIEKFAQFADAVLVGGRLALEEPINIEKVYCPTDYVEDKDIGPNTLLAWRNIIYLAKTVIWAGPVGLFEEEKFSNGTKSVILWLSELTKNGCFTLAGGGDTTAAINKYGSISSFSFVSTGGGAMLDYLVKGTLPGIEALEKCQL